MVSKFLQYFLGTTPRNHSATGEFFLDSKNIKETKIINK